MAAPTTTGGFYADSGSDRPYTYADFNNYFYNLASNGICTRGGALGTELECAPSSGTMNTTISAGFYLINGAWGEVTVAGDLTHGTADVTNPRIDSIIVEKNVDAGTRATTFKILAGTPAGSPSAPSLTQTSTIWQERLYNVTIPANETDADNFTYSDLRSRAVSTFAPAANSIALDRLVALTANRAVYANASGELVVSPVTDTELGYVSGVTSSIQTQLNAAAAALPYCMLKLNTAVQSGSVITWDNEVSDTSNMHDNSTNPSRITIPTGQDGYYQITCNLNKFVPSGTNEYFFNVFVNGSSSGIGIYYSSSLTNMMIPFGGCLSLNAADYIEIKYYTNFSVSDYVASSLSSGSGQWSSFITVKRIR